MVLNVPIFKHVRGTHQLSLINLYLHLFILPSISILVMKQGRIVGLHVFTR